MGVNLARWGSRLCGLLGVPLLAQRVFDIMARDALDYEAADQPGKAKALYTGSRASMAKEIYGTETKIRYLNRPVKALVDAGLITPVGIAHNGSTQWYRLNVDMLVCQHMDELGFVYPKSGQEIGRIARRAKARTTSRTHAW